MLAHLWGQRWQFVPAVQTSTISASPRHPPLAARSAAPRRAATEGSARALAALVRCRARRALRADRAAPGCCHRASAVTAAPFRCTSRTTRPTMRTNRGGSPARLKPAPLLQGTGRLRSHVRRHSRWPRLLRREDREHSCCRSARRLHSSRGHRAAKIGTTGVVPCRIISSGCLTRSSRPCCAR